MTPVIAPVLVIENGSCISLIIRQQIRYQHTLPRTLTICSPPTPSSRTEKSRQRRRQLAAGPTLLHTAHHTTRCREEMSTDSAIMSDASSVAQEKRVLTLNPFTFCKDAVSTVAHHWKNGSINWPVAIYISLVQIAAVVGFCTIKDCKWQTCLLAFILWPIT